MNIKVVEVDPTGRATLLEGIPTPALMQASSEAPTGVVHAFCKGQLGSGTTVDGNVWYLVAPGYSAAPEDIRRVRVERWDQYEVTLTLEPKPEEVEEMGADAFDERVYVEARDAEHAKQLAREKIAKDVDWATVIAVASVNRSLWS